MDGSTDDGKKCMRTSIASLKKLNNIPASLLIDFGCIYSKLH